MKIQKNKNHPKKLLIAALIGVVILVGGYFGYTSLVPKDNTPSNEAGQPAESDKLQAKQLADNPEIKSTRVNTDQQPAPKVDSTTSKTIFPMVASANLTQDSLFIRGGLNGAVVTEGECFALLSGPNGQSLKKSTELLQNAATTDCKTITVNRNELNTGEWTITLNYHSGTAEGSSDGIKIDI
jgi:hypothetical protein